MGAGVNLARRASVRNRPGVPWLPLAVLALAAAFLLAPGSLAEKAFAALHGMCAQRPSHTLVLGGQLLPFDARMTGIYAGFAAATVYLACRGRFRAFRLPNRPELLVLASFVAVMGVDGLNALFDDLGSPLYAPDNRVRLVTGALAGVALAAALCFLLATTLWKHGDWSAAPVASVREAVGLGLLGVGTAALALLGWGWLYAPLALGLVVAATAAVGMLFTATILLVTGRDRRFVHLGEAQPAATAGLLAGVAFALLVAAGRFWLEQAFGLRTLS